MVKVLKNSLFKSLAWARARLKLVGVIMYNKILLDNNELMLE